MKKIRRRLIAVSALLFAVFGVNISIGKYRLWSETGTAAPLDGAPEFLLLLAAVAFFIVATIYSADDADGGKD